MNITIINNAKKIIRAQMHRVITVKGNQIRRLGTNKYMHSTIRACTLIRTIDNPTICHATEERIFSAMQEGTTC